MRRLSLALLSALAFLSMGSMACAANPNPDPGKPAIEITEEQAGRVADALTLQGTASPDVRSARTLVFLARLSMHIGQTEHNPAKAIEAALGYLAGLPASDIVPASASGGGGMPNCVEQHISNMMSCPPGGMLDPAWRACWQHALYEFVVCYLTYGSCVETLTPAAGMCVMQVTGGGGGGKPVISHDCPMRVYRFLLGLGSDGILNARFQINWLPGAPNLPIEITLRRPCTPVPSSPITLSPLDNPSGSWTSPIAFPACPGPDVHPAQVEVWVNMQPASSTAMNTLWWLRLDCN